MVYSIGLQWDPMYHINVGFVTILLMPFAERMEEAEARYVCAGMCVSLYVCVCVSVCVCVCVCVYIYIYIYIHVCIHTYTFIHHCVNQKMRFFGVCVCMCVICCIRVCVPG
jgi:hypothetical protein